MNTVAPTGTARLTLTITTQAKRGKRTVPHVVAYTVTLLDPDRRVAHPAIRLTKDDGEFYDVAVVGGFPTCTCPHAVYRGGDSRIPCKHYLALAAQGLMPRGSR